MMIIHHFDIDTLWHYIQMFAVFEYLILTKAAFIWSKIQLKTALLLNIIYIPNKFFYFKI